jgi:hypothetical protein
LFGRKMKLGGYGSVNAAYTRMFEKDGALIGLEAALLLDHRLSIGLAGYGWTNPQPGPDDEEGRARQYEAGYGGLALRYSFVDSSPVYFTAGGLIGGGAVVLAPNDDSDDDDHHHDIEREDVDAFAVFQPELALNVNVTRWMRLGVMGGYRFVAGIGRFGNEESDVNGLVAGGHVQFGRF